tara:strand:+ start:391 stop:948 length:558 start_codon:yes stop_codon:yes gene_type:complete
MKSFEQYLTESKKTYKFKIRVAGEIPEGFPDTMERALQKYDVINISAGKKTPITEKPMDFPQLQNMEVTHWETEVSYPVTSHLLEKYLVDACGVTHSHIIVRGEHDPIEEYQSNQTEEPYEAKLNTVELGGESAQNEVGENRIMDLLKELETARQERDVDMTGGIGAGKSDDIKNVENAKSVVGG